MNIISTKADKWVAPMAKPNQRTPNVYEWVAHQAKPRWRNRWHDPTCDLFMRRKKLGCDRAMRHKQLGDTGVEDLDAHMQLWTLDRRPPTAKGVADKPLVISAAFCIQTRVTNFQLWPSGKSTRHKLTGHSFSYRRSLGTDGRQVVC